MERDTYCPDCDSDECTCFDFEDSEYAAFQDVSTEQLAGEVFEDRLAMYRNEY